MSYTFVNKLKTLMEKRDMTQLELAKSLNMNQSVISKFLSKEDERICLSIEKIRKLTKVFNVSSDFLFETAQEKNNNDTSSEEKKLEDKLMRFVEENKNFKKENSIGYKEKEAIRFLRQKGFTLSKIKEFLVNELNKKVSVETIRYHSKKIEKEQGA